MSQSDLFGDPPEPPPETLRELAVAARDRGIQTAVDHADAVEPGWSDVAFAYLRQFLADKPSGHEFTGEAVRQFAERAGIARPTDKGAWGAVMRRGARAGLMRKIGFTEATDPKVHCNPVSKWSRT